MRVGAASPTVRQATRADLAALVALEAPPHGLGRWGAAGFAQELALTAGFVWLLELGPGPAKEVAGYLVGRRVADETHLLQLGVHVARRRQGLGRLLLHRLVAYAATCGACRVLLEVRADHRAAQNLYLSLGFVEVGRRLAYYPPDGIDALLFEKTIE